MMEYSNHAMARMRLYNISEAEVNNCLNNKSGSYFVGADVVYVFNEGTGRTLKVRVRGGSEPLIVDTFRVGDA